MPRRFPEDFPRVLTLKDLAEIFQLSMGRVYALQSESAFRYAEIRPRLGHPRFDRARVERHIAGAREGDKLRWAV
jgi:hypothetical protein